jgi:hypothetical protein
LVFLDIACDLRQGIKRGEYKPAFFRYRNTLLTDIPLSYIFPLTLKREIFLLTLLTAFSDRELL